MSQEERTRDEVLNVLVAQTKALEAATQALCVLLGQRDEVTPPEAAPEAKPAPKPRTKKEAFNVAGPPVSRVTGEPVPAPAPAPAPAPVDRIVEIVPTKPKKSSTDLLAAMRACMERHGDRGMAVVRERLAPYIKMSDVPDDQIEATIERLAA